MNQEGGFLFGVLQQPSANVREQGEELIEFCLVGKDGDDVSGLVKPLFEPEIFSGQIPSIPSFSGANLVQFPVFFHFKEGDFASF